MPPADPPIFPMERDPSRPLDPSPDYRRLRDEDPITRVSTWSGCEAWLVTRFDDLRAVLRNAAITSDTSDPGFPQYTPAGREATKNFLPHIDGPKHMAIRRKLAPEFAPAPMAAMRPSVQGFVDGLIDDMLDSGPPSEMVSAFAYPVATHVMCTLMGVPKEDHHIIHEGKVLATKRDVDPAVAAAANDRFVAYVDELVTAKETQPTDDMLGRLVAKHGLTGELGHQEIVDLARMLVTAGYDTTAKTIGLGIVAFLQSPEQYAALAADPDLAPSAVEEVLRVTMITHSGRRRVAKEDVEVGSVTIRAGEGIIAAQDSANRDESQFADPDAFDITRRPNPHVTFGFGPHTCAGAPLARMELAVVFETLARRLPGLRLDAPVEELQFSHDSQQYGAYELPVAW